MSYTTLEMFPDFRVEDLPPIPLLSFGQPTLGQARKHPNAYLESRLVRPLRIEPALHGQIIDRIELYGRPLGAYAQVCQSTAYPKLTAFIEVELFPTAFGWMLNARARHGNQDCVGGTFQLSNYPKACLHLGGWIWFARQWIGSSWNQEPQKPIICTHPLERLDFQVLGKGFTANEDRSIPAAASEAGEAVMKRLIRLAIRKKHCQDG